MLVKPAIVAVTLLALGAGTAVAEGEWHEDCGSSVPWKRAVLLSHEISGLNLLNGLHLTDAQMRDTLRLAREAERLRRRTFKEHETRARELIEALEELKEVLQRTDAQIPGPCEKRVQAADHAVKAAQAGYHESLKGLDARLVALLTDGQLEVIRTFNPCLIPPRELKDPVRAGQAAGQHAEIELHLTHLRNLPGRAFRAIADPLLEKLLDEWTPVLKLTPKMRRAEAQRLKGVLRTARSLDETEFVLRRSELAASVTQAFTSVQAKVTEITDFFSRFSPLGKAGKWLLDPRIVPLLERKLTDRKQAERAGEEPAEAESCDDPNMCGRYGQSAVDTGACPCGKPTFAGFCSRFGVEQSAREACREIIAHGQIRLLDYLCEPTADGTVPLTEMFVRPGKFSRLLASRPAKGEETYAARMWATKRDVHARLRQRLGEAAYGKFLASGMDVFEIHVGNLNRFE